MNDINMNEKKMTLPIDLSKMTFEFDTKIDFLNSSMKEKLNKVFNDVTNSTKRFLVYLRKDENLNGEHEILFGKFIDNPNEHSKKVFTDYCDSNNIKYKNETLEDIITITSIEKTLTELNNKTTSLSKHVLKDTGFYDKNENFNSVKQKHK